MLKLKIILIENLFIFIYLKALTKRKQECQGKNIFIHVSEHNTVKKHITELKKDYNLYLILIFLLI